MAIIVARVYDFEAVDEDSIEDYFFSVIATDSGAEYFFLEEEGEEGTDGGEQGGQNRWLGLDSDRIEMMVLRYYGEDDSPTTAEEWASVAISNIHGKAIFIENNHKTVEEAKTAEGLYAKEAKEYQEDLEDDQDDSSFTVDEDPSTYVLLTDEGQVAALFLRLGSFEDIRTDEAEWSEPTFDQIEELDGLREVTISPGFITVYDQMRSEGKNPTEKDLSDYLISEAETVSEQ